MLASLYLNVAFFFANFYHIFDFQGVSVKFYELGSCKDKLCMVHACAIYALMWCMLTVLLTQANRVTVMNHLRRYVFLSEDRAPFSHFQLKFVSLH